MIFNCPVNIIFPSVNTSVLMVPSYWAELGAVLHAYISPSIGVLLLSIPISFLLKCGRSKYALQLHYINTNMHYNYITSMLFIVFKVFH